MRDLYLAIDSADLINGFDFGGETTMNTEDLAYIKKGIPSMTAPIGM